MSAITNFILIRHGEAEINVNQIVGGPRGDTGLTARGVRAAERLRDRLIATREVSPDVFLASPLPRARQTAEIIAPALAVPLAFDDDLEELRPGEADAMAISDAVVKYGIPDFERAPERKVSPGGESWADLMSRATRAIDRLAAAHEGQTVVMVTHGGFIEGAFACFLRLAPGAFSPVQFATRHTSITHVQRGARWNQTMGWRLLTFNDTRHLVEREGAG